MCHGRHPNDSLGRNTPARESRRIACPRRGPGRYRGATVKTNITGPFMSEIAFRVATAVHSLHPN